jgi:hypothetical protein
MQRLLSHWNLCNEEQLKFAAWGRKRKCFIHSNNNGLIETGPEEDWEN